MVVALVLTLLTVAVHTAVSFDLLSLFGDKFGLALVDIVVDMAAALAVALHTVAVHMAVRSPNLPPSSFSLV